MLKDIELKYQRDLLLTDFARSTLQDRYLREDEESCQEALGRAAVAFADDAEHAQRIYNYASKQWFMYATPVLSNAPIRLKWLPGLDNFNPESFDPKMIGMPISCFLSYVPDSRDGLGAHYVENIWLASMGGGIGSYWGDVRSDGAKTSNGSKSTGSIPFMHVVDSQMLAFNQGTTRRGSYATYMHISHPEILEFIDLRNPTGGDANRKCLNLHNAVVIPDSFMEILDKCETDPDADPSWDLIDPNSGKVVETVDARELVQKLLETRSKGGEPFVMFEDTVNAALPETQKAKGLKVRNSNLCTEITLAVNEDRTAVCCLSSVNIDKADEWMEDPMFIPDLVRFLDNVLEFFIRNAPDTMSKAIYSASMERSIGLGAMGFHSYLQQKNVPIESPMAIGHNKRIFSFIKERAVEASLELGRERGEAPDMEGTGRRNAHLLAIAPNASSGIIVGTSPSIEMNRANAYTHKTMSGSYLVKNRYLEKLLKRCYSELVKNAKHNGFDFPDQPDWLDDVWKHIITNEGSVQDLDFLTDWEKEVYKTAPEADQRWVIDLAADRQEFICQAQSLNLYYPADVSIPTLYYDFKRGWKKKIKTYYYLRSSAIRRAESVSTSVERVRLDSKGIRQDDDECLSCQG